jgi:hypothetical protein
LEQKFNLTMTTPIIPRDLSKRPPHSPRERLAGFVIATRAVDKCRALLSGTPGEYHFDCPMDNLLFNFKGITSEQFKSAVQAASSYEEVAVWLQGNGTSKSSVEVKAWSDATEVSSPMKDPEKRVRFMENCSKLGLNPQMNSTFDWLEADDRETFRGKPA